MWSGLAASPAFSAYVESSASEKLPVEAEHSFRAEPQTTEMIK
jgi:hypothetical protein